MLPTAPVVVNDKGREAVETLAEEGDPEATAVTANSIKLGGGQDMLEYCKEMSGWVFFKICNDSSRRSVVGLGGAKCTVGARTH